MPNQEKPGGGGGRRARVSEVGRGVGVAGDVHRVGGATVPPVLLRGG